MQIDLQIIKGRIALLLRPEHKNRLQKLDGSFLVQSHLQKFLQCLDHRFAVSVCSGSCAHAVGDHRDKPVISHSTHRKIIPIFHIFFLRPGDHPCQHMKFGRRLHPHHLIVLSDGLLTVGQRLKFFL